MKIGIDVGGTKTEGILLNPNGTEIDRKRINTEKSYDGTINGILSIINHFEEKYGKAESVGMGMPGAISNDTALIKNANSIWLNGKPFKQDLDKILNRNINLENDAQKFETIKDLFSSINISQCIIYCNSVKRVNDLEEAMKMEDYPVKKIHGKMQKQERESNYKDFKTGGCRVLISSDLFSRGIDIQQVGIVINFDIPRSEHTYLHRIGRSGRWGRKGLAINLQTRYDIKRLKRFEDYYHTQIMELPMNYIEHLSQ